MDAGLLDVVTCYYNPVRWESRLVLCKQHIAHMLESGVRLTVVECQTGERPFELADIPGINHVAVRSKTLVWNKESLIRVGMSRLDPDWKYVCWTDADIKFRKPDWASETVHALQIYDVIQPWSDAYDLGPNDSHLAAYKSFMHQYWHGHSVVYGVDPARTTFERRIKGLAAPHPQNRLMMIDTERRHPHHHIKHHHHHHGHHHHHHNDPGSGSNGPCPPCPSPPPPYYGAAGNMAERMGSRTPWWKSEGGPHEYPHTGYAWAATRHAVESVGGVFDLAAMGASDYHMALALIGYAEKSIPATVTDSYRKHLMEWQERALRDINYNVGYVQGTVEHSFHGRKSDRRYIDRWQIILEHGFDPDTDVMKNSHGVIELTCRKPKLRHDLDVYLRQRNEDANTL